MQSREETAANVLQETGAALIHAHDDGRIISGQGTISLELLEQAPHIDTIRVPISGLRCRVFFLSILWRWLEIRGGIGCQVYQSCHLNFGC
ncbi:hypothetical protein ES288_A12G258900v1 [Gossypium darwinii]|uniref:Uncharacterized protein n=2 Tax=Gossypium TaxID=3633 RepID=A0A5D2N1A9_GOSTO|nr:hypothetical protein ES288_A12G258900v1 [Gossypium darwinii]TYH97691.1 hypothetical protein ES332_A12G259800v1 [Gossypium tomentosum]